MSTQRTGLAETVRPHLYILSNSFLMCAAISTSFVNSFIAKEASSIATFSISSVISTVLTFACEAHAGRASQLPPMQQRWQKEGGTFAIGKTPNVGTTPTPRRRRVSYTVPSTVHCRRNRESACDLSERKSTVASE